jgi:pimeloyl-ACP methyl ester carboxylesterase
VLLLAVGVIPGAGPAGAASSAETTKPSSPLSWAACPKPPTTPPGTPEPPKGLECANLTVPLDYAKPHGKTIKLALIRVRATDQAHRIGSLVFNFGGPGASGIDPFAAGAGAAFEKLGTRYDLVGFDPRGVGQSSPVRCADDKELDAHLAVDASPDNAEEKAALLSAERALTQECEERSGTILPHVGTVNAARDLDMLRAALGDRKLNYFGFSYGTWLGAGYAHLFPKNVGRLILDGALDPGVSPMGVYLEQTKGFQRALGRFAQWAAQQPGAKKKGLTEKAVIAKIAALLRGLDAKPIHTESGRDLTQNLGEAGVLAALYSKDAWPLLLEGMEQAATDDGTTLLTLADILFQRGPDGHYTNFFDASRAIWCASAPQRYTERDIEKALPAFTKASPIFGPMRAWSLISCTGWPVKGDHTADEVDAPGAPPIVVVGTTGDPATPYAWAPALAKRLGSGVLVTLKGEGHGAYATGDPCIQRTVNGYLLDGKVPANGTTCP